MWKLCPWDGPRLACRGCKDAAYFLGSMDFSSAWVALMVAAPPDTPSLLASTVKVSLPIWMVATPAFSAFTSPMIAPVLSFTLMPLIRLAPAPALAAVLAPALDAEGA